MQSTGQGGNAQAAAGAFVADDGVHQFGCAHNGIDRAGADAGGTADADGFVNQATALICVFAGAR